MLFFNDLKIRHDLDDICKTCKEKNTKTVIDLLRERISSKNNTFGGWDFFEKTKKWERNKCV
jgi:hypothetical protein